MENQRKFLEDHGVKITEIENVINKLTSEYESRKENQSEEGKKSQINFKFI